MAVKLNVNRTQIIDVPVPVGKDKFETFQCEMRILKVGEEELKVADLIVDVKNLELSDEEGRKLNTESTIKAIKNDIQLSQMVANAWALGNQNIVKKQETLLGQPKD